jgi:2-hydroxychromene-2-carboxylate isomerase
LKDQSIFTLMSAVAHGVFGAPALFVNGVLYWGGQGRLDFVREALGA